MGTWQNLSNSYWVALSIYQPQESGLVSVKVHNSEPNSAMDKN